MAEVADNPSTPGVLIADDQDDVLQALRMLLVDAGYRVETAASPGGVLERLRSGRHDLLLMDLNYARDTTSGEEGVQLIREVRKIDEWLPVIVMTAYGNVDIAVRVMQEGAQDLVEKPWDNYRLLNIVKSQLELSASHRRERALEASIRELQDKGEIVAESEAMREVLALIHRVGDSDATVLITGENGVGKGVVASALHRMSTRADKAFLTVDMGTLSGGLVEAELFGHERGAFTDAKGERVGRFELADGGTLFLDEIANCPLSQQSKLLRVIESGEFERLGSSRTRKTDARLLCATNSDLRAEVEGGRFREDLFYRINTVEVHIPALRERTEDILPLARHFLDRYRGKYRRRVEGFTAEAESALLACSWSGNVRELSHAVERAVLLSKGPHLEPADLRLDSAPAKGRSSGIDGLTLEQAEKYLITQALERHAGNVREAAVALGVSRSALYRRLERYGLATGEPDGS